MTRRIMVASRPGLPTMRSEVLAKLYVTDHRPPFMHTTHHVDYPGFWEGHSVGAVKYL
jgi:hypothetical protein